MFQFWKSPKFWVSAIVILWLLYLIDGNLEQPVEIYIIPHFLHRTVRVAAVMAASAIVGSILTIVVQFAWRRRASKNASISAAAAASSTKTVA
jgi:hypothetical protein